LQFRKFVSSAFEIGNAKQDSACSAILAMRPVKHRLQGPPTWNLAFNTVIACLRTMIVAQRSMQYTRGPQIVGRDQIWVARPSTVCHEII